MMGAFSPKIDSLP